MRSAWEEYSAAGMLGAYRTDDAVLRQEEDGVSTLFRDTSSWEREGCFVRERKMLIGWK